MLKLDKTEKFSLKMGESRTGTACHMEAIAFGKGKKPLVMIPGLSLRGVFEASSTLPAMFRIFAKDYRVWVFDRKVPADEGCTIEDLADDLAAAMAALEIEKAHVLGISMGGMIGQYLAIYYPQLVDKLVLGVTASRVNPQLSESVERWLQLAAAGDWRAFGEDMFARMYSEAYLKKHRLLLPLAVRLAKPKNPLQFQTLAKACLTVNCYDRLSEIRCPVLVLGGAEDRVLGAEASAEIAERLQCAHYLYPHLGHSAYEEAPDFNKRVFDFFSSQS